MVRAWGPKLRILRNALRDAILAEQTAQAAQLPAALQGAAFEITSERTRAERSLFPIGMRVLPSAGGTLTGETTKGMQGTLTFPVVIRIKGLDKADMLDLLDEAQGLLLDAVDNDPTLGGLCGGTADPAITVGVQELDLGGDLVQEFGVTLIIRA